MTYSIVARDPVSGELGVAVQSKYFSVGGVVAWAEPGIGAVATQAMADPGYGPRGLDLMRSGLGAPQALAQLTTADELRERRQVGMVDAAGKAAAHTGSGCIAAAGHATGGGYSCQANLMLNNTVWGAMARAYEGAQGPLAERLLGALIAAEGEGGDLRGRQSAALLVVAGDATLPPWQKLVELRVEDDVDPLGEMARLLRLRRAFDQVDVVEASLVGGGDAWGALSELESWAELGDANVDFLRAVALARVGRVDDARELVGRLAALNPGWAVAARRYADAGAIPDDPSLVSALTPPG